MNESEICEHCGEYVYDCSCKLAALTAERALLLAIASAAKRVVDLYGLLYSLEDSIYDLKEVLAAVEAKGVKLP